MIDMSVIYCEVCCEHIDTDFQAEHFDKYLPDEYIVLDRGVCK